MSEEGLSNLMHEDRRFPPPPELAAQANVATVKANADARIAEAEGKAKSSQIEGEALRANPEILRQRAELEHRETTGPLLSLYELQAVSGASSSIPAAAPAARRADRSMIDMLAA